MYYTLLRVYVKLRRNIGAAWHVGANYSQEYDQEWVAMWKYLAIFFLSLAFLLPGQSQAQGVRDYANRADAFFGEVYLGLKYGIYELYDDDLNDGDEAEAGQRCGLSVSGIGGSFDHRSAGLVVSRSTRCGRFPATARV